MSGETNLELLLKNINPVLEKGDYVFCTVSNLNHIDFNQIIGSFKESEGLTIIVSNTYADTLG